MFYMYNTILKTLNKYKGLQLNYDTAIPQIAVEISLEVQKLQSKEIKRIFKEIRKELTDE